MVTKFLLDTNTIIDYQSQVLSKDGIQFITEIINADFTVSFVSYIEFLGYKNVTTKMEDFISLATVIKINQEIINQTIELRKSYKVKLPDAIIAATTIVYDQTLITNNTNDFKDIIGLKVVNPYKI